MVIDATNIFKIRSIQNRAKALILDIDKDGSVIRGEERVSIKPELLAEMLFFIIDVYNQHPELHKEDE